MTVIKDLFIRQGATWTQVIRWEVPPIVYKPVTGISQAAPVNITCVGHGIPPGWRVAVVSVKGMTAINASSIPPKDKDYHAVTLPTVNPTDHVELNDVNSTDYKGYVSGGYLLYNTPMDMASYSARMSIKDKVGGTELLRLDTTGVGITIDNTLKTITLTISATLTAALMWVKGVYDLELVSPGGVVTALLSGKVTVTKEITTT